jgi:choline dehydrogenase-like flavoprotein
MSSGQFDCIVIGSGPSGTACAAALLENERSVLMLDAGLTIEPERMEAVRKARICADFLSPSTAPWLSERPPDANGEIPRKLMFGSDFPFRAASEHLRLTSTGVGLEPSFAFGGFSNIWGAAVMPYVARDIASWPIGVHDLAPHYAACEKLLGLSADHDDLAADYPLYATPSGQVAASAQASALLHAMCQNRSRLAAAGICFGRARLAIRPPQAGAGCIYCGLCLHGCPDDLIFRTPALIPAFERKGRLVYRPGVVVESVYETQNSSVVQCYDLETRARLSFEARRAFIAGGPISTTSILMRSGGLFNTPIHLKDSQYFLLPLLTAKGIPRVAEERLHTLSQIFMQIVDEKLGDGKTSFLQIYSYNSLLGDEVRRKLRGIDRLASPLLARLMLIQGYLHSDLSGGIDIVLAGRPGTEELRMMPALNASTKSSVGKVIRKLFSVARQIGAMPLPMLLRMGEPGRGFHSGGSFPMSATPGQFETDTLGRPFGWNRVHAVDSTVLPSIAATTITFTVMANAHRIGTTVTGLDRV